MHHDYIDPHPLGLPQEAIVVSGNRFTWISKQLVVKDVTKDVTAGATPYWHVSPQGQTSASPVWSPDGEQIAYVGMPNGPDVVGGPLAQAALMKRRIWLAEAGGAAPRQLTDDPAYRDERPHWLDNQTLLFARLDEGGRGSLWLVDINDGPTEQVVAELSPAPEWFGNYGYINWDELFDVWGANLQGQAANRYGAMPVATPTPALSARSLAAMLPGLHGDLTATTAVAQWGEPDEVTGSGLLIYKYRLNDGLVLVLAFPGGGPISYARLESPDGATVDLDLTLPLSNEPSAGPTRTPTPTPTAWGPFSPLPTPLPPLPRP
jgi:hypothetical protein